MRCCVDEVRECDESSRKTDSWTIQCCNENLGMCIECVGDVEVIRDEGLEPVSSKFGGVGARGTFAGDSYVCSSMYRIRWEFAEEEVR